MGWRAALQLVECTGLPCKDGPVRASRSFSFMTNVVRFRKPSNKERAQGKTLCRSGFHKWVVDKKKQFDVKQGKLVTVHRCRRCGVTRVTAL